MRILMFFVLIVLACQGKMTDQAKVENSSAVATKKHKYAMVIHGGAGTIRKENMSEEKEKAYRDKLQEVLDRGQEILQKGGSSLDAVEQCIKIMENSPLFNAGKGSVFTHEETNEMDASIMVGSNLEAGAVAGVTRVKNPISAARAVMERSKHVMLTGKGADTFAEEQNLEMVDPSYFKTEERLNRLKKAKQKSLGAREKPAFQADSKYGTVGVVALDNYGQIAAGTSTGGMTNKRWNRIGDSPVIGAGTYAENGAAGVSCTGHGEFFIRYAVAHEIISRVKYLKVDLQKACEDVVLKTLKDVEAAGGLIALDQNGHASMVFNTPGMYRGYINPDESFVGLYEEDGAGN